MLLQKLLLAHINIAYMAQDVKKKIEQLRSNIR